MSTKKVIIHSIKVVVEAPDGHTWDQEIEVKDNDVDKAIKGYKKVLGRGYMICDWYKWRYEEVEEPEPEPHYVQMSIFDFID